MGKKEIRRAHVLRNYLEGIVMRRSAAEAIGVTERQITRLARGMAEEGERALIHKNRGRQPRHALAEEVKARIIGIRESAEYEGCNIRHFRELLERESEILISYSALYGVLKGAGIVSPKKHGRVTVHRQRKRKAAAGELIQIDGTPYEWFGDGKVYTLHGAVDDATGELTGLYMTENECLQGYFEVAQRMCLGHGVPLTMYSDRHTIFRSPLTARKEAEGEEANLTQFGRAMAELGVNLIYATTPQAKGRIERVWETLQSRLPVEFRLRRISTVEAANAYLAEEYPALFNGQFAVTAESASMFVPYKYTEDINTILCVKEHRKTDNAGGFSFGNRSFRVLDEGYPLIPARASVEVLVSVHDSVRVRYNNRVFETEMVARVKAHNPSSPRGKKIPSDVEARVVPHLVHGSDEWKRLWHYESYEDSLAFLYEVFFKSCA